MADEHITDPSTEPSQAQQRITDLSSKVREASEQRDTKERERLEAVTKMETAEKERDFYAGFSDVVATNPAAKDHKDDILSKVKSGYTVQDATFAVLGAAGKLGAQAPAPASPTGGSASNAITGSAEKPVSEMTQTEKREQLAKDLIWQN